MHQSEFMVSRQVIGLPDCGESRSKDASTLGVTYQQLRRSHAARALGWPPSVQPGSNAHTMTGPALPNGAPLGL